MAFDERYFSTHTYQRVSYKRFHQYWWSNRFYSLLVQRYGNKGRPLLEIGSGLGHLAGRLQSHFQTFAVDVNLWAMQQGKNIANRCSFSLASAEELPFATGSFGTVILKHVVEHLTSPGRAIHEASRLIVPGGVLILSTPNLDSLLKPWKGDQWIGFLDPTHISLKSPAEWLDIITQAGFAPQLTFADGFWDVPYIKHVPDIFQKVFFGFPGGIQAITGIPFLPLKWGETLIVVAQKEKITIP